MKKTFRRFAVLLALVVILASVHNASAQEEGEGALLPEFFSGLYARFIGEFSKVEAEDYELFCEDNDVDPKNATNRDTYFKLLFYHKMFTGTTSYNCATGGKLKIPYFWHWVEPNPRHKIIDNLTGKMLTKKKPPKEFAKYKSFADIDRTPRLFLKDLVSPKPRYRHPGCGEFYTFGWCSEREMSFSLFMSLYGYKSKILQEGIHVTSNFWLDFVDRGGKEVNLIAIVDNTYGYFTWEKAPLKKFDKWYGELGRIKMAKWYNKIARSLDEREAVMDIRVPPEAAKRITDLLK